MPDLIGTNGVSLGLTVLGYEFPELGHTRDNEWDRNWLMMRMQATDDDRVWTADAPALLTWELKALAEWLRHVGTGERDPVWFYPSIEPEIAFRWTRSSDLILHVLLSHSFHPNDPLKVAELQIDTCEADVSTFAVGLDAELDRLPVRMTSSTPG